MDMHLAARATALCGALAIAACGGGNDGSGDAPTESAQSRENGAAAADPAAALQLSVVSGDAQWVSGNDARIHLRVPRAHRGDIEWRLNGKSIDIDLQPVGDGLEGVVRGLRLGKNRLEVRRRGDHRRDTLTLTNWPIEGPMFTGPQQTPFVCTTIQSAVQRQPLVDSASAPGYRVADAAGQTIGYSRDCSIDTFVTYLYRSTANSWKPLPTDGSAPADMSRVTLADGSTVDFIVRREIGSINRFLYSIAMLSTGPAADTAA